MPGPAPSTKAPHGSRPPLQCWSRSSPYSKGPARGHCIQRSTSQHDAQQLTPLGDKLLEQANRHLGASPTHHHGCPSSLSPAPEPRRSRRRAWHRHRHLNPASEASKLPARTPLLARDSPRSRHRLTALGRQFMKQVQGWEASWKA